MPLSPQEARKKARALITQALDDSTTLEERRTFAMQAAKIIDRHELLEEPFDVVGSIGGVEVGEAAGALADLVGKFQKSGLADALKRTINAGRRVSESRRKRREDPDGVRRRRR